MSLQKWSIADDFDVTLAMLLDTLERLGVRTHTEAEIKEALLHVLFAECDGKHINVES